MSCCTMAHSLSPFLEPADLQELDQSEDQQLLDAAVRLPSGELKIELVIPNVHCGACIKKIEDSLDNLQGVKSVRLNLSQKTLELVWNAKQTRLSTLTHKLSSLGFSFHVVNKVGSTQKDAHGQYLLVCLAVAGFAATNVMLLSVSVWAGANAETARLFQLLSGLIAIPAAVFAGRPFFTSAWQALRVNSINMDVPISLAVVLSLAVSLYEVLTGNGETYFDAAITLLFFLLVGRYLDHFVRRRALGAVESLAKLAGKGSKEVKADGSCDYVALDNICKGMKLLILPGERLPVDAQLLTEQASFDRALVTGESNAVTLQAGTKLEAVTLNLSTPIYVQSLGNAQNSYLAEVAAMMEAAKQSKSRYVRIADQFASYYAPLVHLFAAATFVGWFFIIQADVKTSVWTAVTVLIVTCPCALALAVPVAQVVAAKLLFDRGIMIKDGAALERLANLTHIAFDKTGTLTTNQPAVNKQIGKLEKPELVAELAKNSEHPFAKAILHSIASNKGKISTKFKIEEIVSTGVSARSLNGKEVRLGKPEWVQELVSNPQQDAFQHKVFIGTSFIDEEGRLTNFQFDEELAPAALESLQELHKSGMQLQILSGDNEKAVEKVARRLGNIPVNSTAKCNVRRI